jgi:hypothetical protein
VRIVREKGTARVTFSKERRSPQRHEEHKEEEEEEEGREE